MKSELQSLLLSMETHLEEKVTHSPQEEISLLRQLLCVTLKLLRNYAEMYDTRIQITSFDRFLLQKFSACDQQIRFWTGFPSCSALRLFIDHFVAPNLGNIRYWGSKNREIYEDGDKCGPKRSIDPEDELFMTLVKLKQGSANEDLAERFSISQAQTSRIFVTWVNFLFNVLTKVDIWMSKKKVAQTLPKVFQGIYDDVIIILDCTEMECERPSDLELQAATYSQYKSRNTVKALVGIAPAGIPTFISDLMEGSVSDNEITMKCGLLDRMPKDCAIMADRGWTNREALARHGVRLVTPAFLMDKKQLDLPALTESVSIARVRIHVER